MLKGNDVSHWQTKTPTNVDFIIAKASEGISNKDSKCLSHLSKAKKSGIELFGIYHYARTNTDWKKNADNFLSVCEKIETIGSNVLLALDIEGIDANRKNAVEWCKNWLLYVERKTGIKPLVYTSKSNTKKFEELAKLDFGLWVAHWTKNKKPTFEGWKIWALWQYSDGNGVLDYDYFNGTKKQFLKYCEGVVK